MSFRWYGANDNIPLSYIRQIPGVAGVVSALHGIGPGQVWPVADIVRLRGEIRAHGLELSAVESLPVSEEIKAGGAGRDRDIENYCRSLRNLGTAGITVVCYNFMPLVDWFRTDLEFPLPDGSTTLAYDEKKACHDPVPAESFRLPGWFTEYGREEFAGLLRRYAALSEEDLWKNLAYFLAAVVPVAEAAGVRLAIHPDDPPWPVLGLPRIMRDRAALERLVGLGVGVANGICLCTGSLGADPGNDVPEIIRHFGRMGRIHFVHLRNVKVTGDHSFYESGHLSAAGSIDMYAVMAAIHETGFDGPVRPDHGRSIWGEKGRPGYGLYDRALGAAYLAGLWEAIVKQG